MASNAERQKAFRQRMAEKGFVPITAYVPASQASDVLVACAELCNEGATLELGPFRNYSTGKLVRRKR